MQGRGSFNRRNGDRWLAAQLSSLKKVMHVISSGVATEIAFMRRAFTLVELVATIVVLSVLAAIAIPRYFDVTAITYRSMASGFEAHLKEARTAYIGLHGATPTDFTGWVSFDAAGSSIAIISVDQGLRENLADPTATVLTAPNLMTMQFRNGLLATYSIDSEGTIAATYVGP